MGIKPTCLDMLTVSLYNIFSTMAQKCSLPCHIFEDATGECMRLQKVTGHCTWNKMSKNQRGKHIRVCVNRLLTSGLTGYK